jgi:hypothetical protein
MSKPNKVEDFRFWPSCDIDAGDVHFRSFKESPARHSYSRDFSRLFGN